MIARLEKWLFPPKCVITGEKAEKIDLRDVFIQQWRRPKGACPVCGRLGMSGRICGQCLKAPPAYERTQAAFLFDHELRNLIHQYKYYQQLYLSRLLAQAMQNAIDPQGVQALVPIPLHPKRLRERGYNQAGELARVLGQAFNLPVIHALERLHNTPSQTQLKAEQRKQNLKKAFRACESCLQEFDSIAIVDDVITSGSTMHFSALALKHSHPKLKIQAWAIAQA